MGYSEILLILMYALNIGAIISIVFSQKKGSSSSLAWLLVFIFIPLVGFILYFFFGSTSKIKMLSKRYRDKDFTIQYEKALWDSYQKLENKRFNFSDSRITEYEDIILMNTYSAESIYSQDNKAILLVNAKAKYDMLFEDIENAKESINVLYFIFKTHHDIGKKFIELLAKKAREGVTVRLIYDSLGCLNTRYKHFSALIDAGGMVYKYLPSAIKTAIEANYRMHRKMVIIDGVIAYTGGINIGDDYLGKDARITPWRDTSVKLLGSCVQSVQLRFLNDWIYIDKQVRLKKAYKSKVNDDFNKKMYFKATEKAGDMGVQIISSGPNCDYSVVKDQYTKLISSAKKYLYIQTPYFVPDETLMHTLRIAAHSGTEIAIMIPGVPDKRIVYYITMSYARQLLDFGIKVYIYKGFLHSKTFLVDDIITSIGTANLDIRSFDLDFELNTIIYDSEFAKQNKQVFLNDIKSCRQLTKDDYKKMSFIQKGLEGFFRLIAPLT